MRLPHYIQNDAMDCGPSCLRMIAKYYGHHYTLQTLRNISPPLTEKGHPVLECPSMIL
nr:cysteine peptidase family C39 domain-containing protein [Alloprevotella rava]